MSVKKLLILTAAGVASVGMTAAIAGGPHMAPPAPVADSYFYIEGDFGYASQDFAGATMMGPAGAGVLGTGSQGGLVYGGDIGYMFNQYLGLEAGWMYLPRFADTGGAAAAGPGNFDLRSTNGAWGVVKLVAPLTQNIDAFFKAGVGYRYGRIIWNAPAVTGSSQMKEVRPLLAVGGTYNIGQEWMTSVQFMHFVGGTTYNSRGLPAVINSVIAPASNVITLNVGYKFTV